MSFKYFIYQGVLLTKFLNFLQFFRFVNNKKKKNTPEKKTKTKFNPPPNKKPETKLIKLINKLIIKMHGKINQ